jgi:hypothetical protein
LVRSCGTVEGTLDVVAQAVDRDHAQALAEEVHRVADGRAELHY